jgi:hypothetical protein
MLSFPMYSEVSGHEHDALFEASDGRMAQRSPAALRGFTHAVLAVLDGDNTRTLSCLLRSSLKSRLASLSGPIGPQVNPAKTAGLHPVYSFGAVGEHRRRTVCKHDRALPF